MAVTVSELKSQLNISLLNTSFDNKLSKDINAATNLVEKYTNRKLLTQTVTEYFDGFPDTDRFNLPYGNLSSITSVNYKDTSGSWTELSSTYYSAETEEEPGKVVLNDGYSWPTTTLHPSKPIKVVYVCGYGASNSDVPQAIRSAILLIAADLFENRELRITGLPSQRLQTDAILLSNYILHGGYDHK